jgi:hypothetical protein
MIPVGRTTTVMRCAVSLLTRPAVKALFVAGAALTGYHAARATPPAPAVVTLSPETLEARAGRVPRGTALAAPPSGQTGTSGQTATSGQTTTTQVACTSPAPDASATCVNGFWQTPAAATTGAGAARFDRANGCVTVQPANDMICRSGLWTLRGAETAFVGQQPSIPGSPAITASDPNAATTSTTTDPTRPPSLQVPSITTVSPALSAGTPANPVAGGSVGAGTCPGSPPPVLPSQSLACVNGAWVVR